MRDAFPSKKMMYTLISLLILGFAFFYINSLKKSLYQLSFDWENQKTIQQFNIDAVKDIEDNLLTLRLVPETVNFDNQFTYCIKGSKDYYFRYTYAIIEHDFIRFEGLVWINKQPEITEKFTTFSKVNLPLKKHPDGITTTTIGDELIYINEAKYLRKELYSNHNINFSGQKSDVYNIPYFEISDSEINPDKNTKILIFFSTNYPEKMYELANKHLSDSENKIIVISQPNHLKTLVKPFNKEKITHPNQLVIVDPNPVFEKNPDLYYFDENRYLTKEAYLVIADLISKQIR